MNPQHDTDRALSAKGSWWTRKDGKVLVVGKGKDIDDWILEQHAKTAERNAKAAS